MDSRIDADASARHDRSTGRRHRTVKQIVWLTVGPTACGAYRCYVPALSLSASGRYVSRFISLAASPSPGPRQRDVLSSADIVVLQRNLTDAGEAWADACDQVGARLVYEIDDDVPNIPPHHPFYDRFATPDVRRRLGRFVAQAHCVIASTAPLASSLCRVFDLPASAVSVAHNHLHEFVWGPHNPEGCAVNTSATHVTIGWQGTPTHDADFVQVWPALERLLATEPAARLRFFGGLPRPVHGDLPRDRIDVCPPVVFQRYPEALRAARLDIGLSPLADDAFNASKSNLKWLEYSACGIATVASPVQPYRTSIVGGETGLLANTADEWYDALVLLVRDAARRNRLATAARDAAWREWSASTRSAAWVDLFDRIP
jgi:glycosyltransferase involved in cell wall biosynthesis